MSSMMYHLARPRSLFALVVIIPLLTLLLYLRQPTNPLQPFTATGYQAPTKILPSYESTSNIPFCLPHGVDEYEMYGSFAGFHDKDGKLREGHEEEASKDTVPVKAIKEYMRGHIRQKQAGFDPVADEEFLGLRLGNGTIDLEGYTKELLATYEEYLSVPHIPTPSFLPLIKSRLSLSPPILPLPPRPRVITTTDAHRDLVPWQFGRWKELLPDWEVRVMEDADMEGWMREVFGGTRGEEVWKALPRIVLKTDILRYFILLVEGGIYSDSDTAPIIDPDLWGYPYNDATDPLLIHLSRVLSLSNPTYRIKTEAEQAESDSADEVEEDVFRPRGDRSEKRSTKEDKEGKARDPLDGIDVGPGMKPIVEDGAELGPPSLVVSVESDAIEFGWTNWREVGLSRADQIVQWTIMARPGHPVFLDAIGRSLRKSIEMDKAEKAAVAKGEVFLPESALEWTGPGIFTDSVMRYLLVRYGFQPRELLHVKDPIRVGDVLIVRQNLVSDSASNGADLSILLQLPAGSYSSVSPFTGEAQRKWAASYHGFFGRWRDADPQIQEQERLKKIKEDEEKENERLKEEQESEGRVDTEEVSME